MNKTKQQKERETMKQVLDFRFIFICLKKKNEILYVKFCVGILIYTNLSGSTSNEPYTYEKEREKTSTDWPVAHECMYVSIMYIFSTWCKEQFVYELLHHPHHVFEVRFVYYWCYYYHYFYLFIWRRLVYAFKECCRFFSVAAFGLFD